LSDRLAPEKLCSIGLVALAAGLASLATLGAVPSPFDIAWRLGICGLGFGLFQSPNNRVIIGSAPRERSGGASGLQSLGRLLGQSLGAVAVALVFGLARGHNTTLITGMAATLSLAAACASAFRRRIVHP
jgi:DHA2 family multidrug resistance protein-like MFS transporter